MIGWLQRAVRAIVDSIVDTYCPWGEWPAADCRGCALDRQWVGSLPDDHRPHSAGSGS